jgi:hydrogenase maturation factor
VHSGASIKKILEKEAKKQLLMQEPNIVTINAKGGKNELDVSNLPYLHRNPAI